MHKSGLQTCSKLICWRRNSKGKIARVVACSCVSLHWRVVDDVGLVTKLANVWDVVIVCVNTNIRIDHIWQCSLTAKLHSNPRFTSVNSDWNQTSLTLFDQVKSIVQIHVKNWIYIHVKFSTRIFHIFQDWAADRERKTPRIHTFNLQYIQT